MFSSRASAPWGAAALLTERLARWRWERDVRWARAQRRPDWRDGRRRRTLAHGLPAWRHVTAAAGGLSVHLAPHLRHALLAVSVGAAAATAYAAAVAASSYADNPPGSWAGVLAQRRHSPIWDREGKLAGSVGSPDTRLDLESQRNQAFIPLTAKPPTTFVAALKELEDRNFGEGGWRSWCGIDVPSLVWRWISSGGVAGGSGLTQQLTRQLKPEWGNETTLVDKAGRKFRELGAACSLWKSYQNKGGADAILTDYTATAPMLQGGGTLRGIEAASHITFGVEPAKLTDGQQLLFAAALKRPLRLLQPGDLGVACDQVYPVGSPTFDAALAAAHAARVNQCRVIWRALSVAPKVLQGVRLQVASDELREMQRNGIQVANEFHPLPAARLINLTGRTAAMLPSSVVRMMVNELDQVASFQWGEPISLTFDANFQRRLGSSFVAALSAIQQGGKRSLCIPLLATDPPATGFTRLCGPGSVEGPSADVFAMTMTVREGAVQGVYSSSPAMLDAPLSAGSLAKWVIMLAAVEAGIDPGSTWCPRRTFDGARQLRRVGADPLGYTDAQCARGGRYGVRLVDAIARSDNLVAAEVARYLGDQRLRAALDALGLKSERDRDLWYPLAFGTQPATPRNLLAAGRALIAAAYDIEMVGLGPRVLAGVGGAAAVGGDPVRLHALTPIARDSLRRLLEAPVAVERGTLGFVADVITAGKTGTTSSESRDVNGHRNVHAKLALSYLAQQGTVQLLVVTAPRPSVPLALHITPGSIFAPAHRALMQSR